MRYDSAHVAMQDGNLRIRTQPGDINASANDDPRNFVLQPVPAGDWTVETRLTPSMLHRWQLAGLLVYGDDDNYVKFDVLANNASDAAKSLAAELVSEKDGQFGNGGNRNIDIAESTESGWYQLRLSKSGDTYSAQISADGVTWQSLGDPVTNDADLTSVGLMAIGPEQTEPVTVAFDYFRVGDAPDREAPVVTTTVTEPDGANGWHRTPATVTATATDDRAGEVTIEYRAGDGDWMPYEAPVVLSADGTHELEFRATDAAGNVSSPVPAMAMVDATAPVLAITGVTAEGTYDVGTALDLAATADDPSSGVGSVQLTLDGAPVQGPVTPVAGGHEVRAVATDEAGNAAEVVVPFTVTVTYDQAAELLTQYATEGRISLSHYFQLYVYLRAAQSAEANNLPRLANVAMDRFATVAGKVHDPDARAQLQAIATYLKGDLTT